ncbi:cytochrome P450 [Sphingomonas sp. C8-2]|jgi:cytochrome P450|uniref:Cytochrome P450 n=1 Tax=Rhizorhabdus histidinilytica TaxID=439228 RepID=A0A1T5A6J6_9SPHN|nr:cytochrome P450 [Rhizorhabdus histidinilytica]QEH78217.1 cytochrome P450 [Sphingomonas sp. C8-2]SKB30377.1 Cytochrome P450 [Rhizorhabdus histidinilytica]
MQDVMERTLAPRPEHVPAELVRDFDLYDIPGAAEDIQAAYRAIQQASPDIFWTPHNGGHWVATRGEDIVEMQRDYNRFSHQHIVLPPMPDAPRQIPLEMDPPEHARYRRPLMQALLPSIVSELESKVRQVAIDAVERLLPRGECEFVEDFAKVLPIHVFLELVELPLDDKAYLLALAEDSVRGRDAETRGRSQQLMGAYLLPWIRARREMPGNDLLSKLVNVDIGGERISEAEATSYATLVLFGGLDTVAGMIAFIARFLAQNPEQRRQLVERLDDDAFVKNAIEEMVRRHGLANTARVIASDFDYKGVSFRAGDRILPANLFVGVDDRINPDPLVVDFSREKPVHAAFGNGAHACPGAVLARREIRIFLQEWLSRIPDFRIKPGTRPVLATGMVNGVLRLELVWP